MIGVGSLYRSRTQIDFPPGPHCTKDWTGSYLPPPRPARLLTPLLDTAPLIRAPEGLGPSWATRCFSALHTPLCPQAVSHSPSTRTAVCLVNQ